MRRQITRRTLLAATAALPAALPLAGAGAGMARAAAPMLGAGRPAYNRFKLGAFEVTTLLAGTMARPDPHSIFGLDVSEEEFNAVSRAAYLPTDVAQFFFTPTVVNTGAELVLFDTGLDPAGITGGFFF